MWKIATAFDCGPFRVNGSFIALAVVIASLAPVELTAQISDKVERVTVGELSAGTPAVVEIDLVRSDLVERIEIAYRSFGQRDFQRSEMAITGNQGTISLPSTVVNPPFVEYYFLLYLRGSSTPETFPLENAEQQPLRATVLPIAPQSNQAQRITVLSPEENERVAAGDVLISFVIAPGPDSSAPPPVLKVYLDGADISTHVILYGDLAVVKPENASITPTPGFHTVRVEMLDTLRKPVQSATWQFVVTGAKVQAPSPENTTTTPWRYGSSVQLETRSEEIASATTPYNRATISASGSYNDFKVDGRLHITNEETDNRQPQNRYFIGAESPWLNVGFGDSYPVFPDLIMSGKRVRGLTANLTLGKMNLDISQGQVDRQIEGTIGVPFADSRLDTQQRSNPSSIFIPFDSTSAGRRWVMVQPGTFSRNIIAVRPSFGPRDGSHWGFTYLKSSDDVNSIHYGIQPKENLVVGSDFLIAIDRHNIEITGQAAFSATNEDISGGTFTDADIDRVFPDSSYSESTRNSIRAIRDVVSRFITVNQYLVPLGTKNLPTLAYDGGIVLNYFNNNLRASYLRHGISYESFGEEFVRQPDAMGYNISDRLALLDNRLSLSAGIERLTDNTAQTKAATTTSTTVNTSVSYYPRTTLPDFTVGYLHASNLNDYHPTDSLSRYYVVDDQTNRILFQLGKDFPFAGARHTASLGVSTSIRDDRTVRNLDTRGTSVTLNNTSAFTFPLTTSVGVIVNSNSFITYDTAGNRRPTSLSYTTLSASAQYNILEGKLRIAGMVSPTFGDLERTLIDGSARYFFLPSISMQAQLTVYLNRKMVNTSSAGTDVVWSLTLRGDV